MNEPLVSATLGWIQGHFADDKSQIQMVTYSMTSYITFWTSQNYKDGKEISGF